MRRYVARRWRAIGGGWLRREAVGRAFDTAPAAVEHVGVDHGGLDVAMAEDLLHGADVVAGVEEARGEAVAQGVRADRFGGSRLPGCGADRLL
ncbi:MAG: hypothetical protein ACRDQZ_26840 [Mycobacteriales bacterium]